MSQVSRAVSLANLQNVIVRYAIASQQNVTLYTHLPVEKDVLSVLLMSFLSQSTGRIVDEERRLSMEIMETIVKTWRVRPSEVCYTEHVLHLSHWNILGRVRTMHLVLQSGDNASVPSSLASPPKSRPPPDVQ